MGSFSKVTNFLRDVLLSENPQARPKEEVAELLHDDIPGMEVNHQDEPGFEVVTKVIQIFFLLLLPAHNQERGWRRERALATKAEFSTSGMVTTWRNNHYVQGFAPTLTFLWNQILCRLYQIPSDGTVN